MIESAVVRRASESDVSTICEIYNQGIEDRDATLETDLKTPNEMASWFADHGERYAVIVVTEAERIVGWASLNPFSHRCAHAAIADLSVYVARTHRGRGLGSLLLTTIEQHARDTGFRKIVLHALDRNHIGKRLYQKSGFREVGVFRQHGVLDGQPVDVVAMEKIL